MVVSTKDNFGHVGVKLTSKLFVLCTNVIHKNLSKFYHFCLLDLDSISNNI